MSNLTLRRAAAWLHFSRMGWLLVSGLGHAYLIWHSDIVVTYAICVVVVYFIRKLSATWLTLWGLLAVAVPSLIYLVAGMSLGSQREGRCADFHRGV